jgi:hypothetical protein
MISLQGWLLAAVVDAVVFSLFVFLVTAFAGQTKIREWFTTGVERWLTTKLGKLLMEESGDGLLWCLGVGNVSVGL